MEGVHSNECKPVPKCNLRFSDHGEVGCHDHRVHTQGGGGGALGLSVDPVHSHLTMSRLGFWKMLL